MKDHFDLEVERVKSWVVGERGYIEGGADPSWKVSGER